MRIATKANAVGKQPARAIRKNVGITAESNAVGKQHAQIIRENVGIAADFVKNHAATGLGASTGYVTGFLQGLFGGKTTVPNA